MQQVEDPQVNGVERMIYMSSTSSSTGAYSLTVTFDVGTDLDQAQVLVQNRIALAAPFLPAEVRDFGITVKKAIDQHLAGRVTDVTRQDVR